MVADIRTHHLGGASLRAIPAAAGVSTNTVARALKAPEPVADPEAESAAPAREAEP
jgi:lambda repressor-like predicted transcriptional regulator